MRWLILVMVWLMFISSCGTLYESKSTSNNSSMLIYECSFQHGIDKSSWEIGFGGFYPSRNHGLMVDTGGTAIIWFRTPLDDFILEFDAESIHGSGVSIALCGLGKGGSFDLGYHIGFGEYDNTKTFIRRLGVTVVENNRELIEHDKKYHVKVQKYGGTRHVSKI